MAIDIGVDIGGTFTDLVCRQPGAPATIMKVPTTREDASRAVIAAMQQLQAEAGVSADDVSRFVHGTTVATNAVLERKGAKVGILTTAGFRDVLEIGRQFRQNLYGAILEPETPGFIAPGARRMEIGERIDSHGAVVTPLDEKSVIAAIDALAAMGVEAVAVVYLFSFLNDAHERRTAEIIAERHPDIAISLSCEVDPAFREYERTLVTAFDAYIKPIVDRYLRNLENDLRETGVAAPLQIMQSRGGLAGTAVARQRPVRLFLSGPAGGVIGARDVGLRAGQRDLISIDIGGTTADIALIEGGEPVLRHEGRIDRYDVRVPMIDINPVGAGGGSIAWIDPAGGLRVGPQSAGAEPGPACYGRGGSEATVTDASIVLGYLDPGYFAGGALALQPDLARRAVEENVATPLGLGIEEAALGMHRVLNAQMAEGIRLVSVKRGYDPRRFALVALGGAGPVHAAALAGELGIARILVPRHPGVLAADGLLAAPVEHESASAFPHKLNDIAPTTLREGYAPLEARCRELMALDGVLAADTEAAYAADVCFVGQSHHLEVQVDPAGSLDDIHHAFLSAHDQTFGYSADGPTCFVNLRCVLRSRPRPPAIEDQPAVDDGIEDARKGERQVRWPSAGDVLPTPVYARDRLPRDAEIDGPAIVEQDDSTVLVPPGWRLSVAADGILVMDADGTGRTA